MKISSRIGCALCICFATAGCATDELYSPIAQRSPPQRWADPVPVCTRGVTLLAKLQVMVGGVYVPEKPSIPCVPPDVAVNFDEGDHAYIGKIRVDPSGRGEYAMSYYELEIDNARERQRGEGLVAEQLRPILKARTGLSETGEGVLSWRHHKQIYANEKVINGRSWQHYAFAIYDSLSEDASKPGIAKTQKSVSIAEDIDNAGSVAQITEVYVYPIDGDHAVIAFGRYDRAVIEDSEWYASRSALLARMVEALELRDVTDSDVEKARSAYKMTHPRGSRPR